MEGKDHATVALAIWAGTTATSWVLYNVGYQEVAAGAILGGFTGWLITPDIDVNGTTHEEYRLYKLFWPLGFVWQNIWAPYGLIFSHRGWSHTPVIGTLTRVVYSLIIAILSTVTFNEWIRLAQYDKRLKIDPMIPLVFFWHNMEFCLAWFVVWCIQDIAHYVADKVSTAAKKEARRAVTKGEDW